MSIQPNTTMTAIALRAYVLAHRDEEEALHAYVDRLHAENRDSQVYPSSVKLGRKFDFS